MMNLRLEFKKIMDIARELSLDEKQLLRDMNDRDVLRSIHRDVREGRRIGFQRTPTVFVNGVPLRNRNFDGFQADIENILDGLDRGSAFSANSALDHRP